MLPRLFVIALALGVVAPAQGRLVTGNVVDGDSGKPVANARVSLHGGIQRGRERAHVGETTTGADGKFRFEGLRRGPLMIQVVAGGYARVGRFLNGDDASADLKIRLAPGRDAVGKVTDSATGKPISGARIAAEFFEVAADAEGRFTVQGLPRGAVEELALEFSAPGYVPQDIPVPAGKKTLKLDVKLDYGRIVAVRVTDDDGKPLSGVRVRGRLPTAAAYSGIERADFFADTDVHGLAVVTGLPPGLPVAVEAEGQLLGTQTVVGVPVLAPRGGARPRPTLALVVSKGRRASLLVMDGYKRPIAGAEVRVLPLLEPLLNFGGGVDRDNGRGGVRTGTTDDEGAVSWDLLPASRLTFEVRAVGWHTKMIVLEPSVGGSPAEVVMDPDPDPPGTDLHWGASLASAFRRAADENLPVMISMSMDNERANDWMAGHHFHDREIVRVTRELPIILTNVFGAGGAPSTVGHTEEGGVCTRYGHIPCAVHQASERWCVDELIGQGVSFQVPRHIVIAPDGEVMMHRTYYLSERDLVRMVIRAIRHVQPSRAVTLARRRLSRLRHRLVDSSADARASAARDLVALVNSGDEHAVALLADLTPLGVLPSVRRDIASGIVVDALGFPDSALRPFVTDPDPIVRQVAVARTAGARDADAIVRLLSDAIVDPDRSVAESARTAIGVGTHADGLVVLRPQDGNRWRLLAGLLRARPATEVSGMQHVLRKGGSVGRNRILRILVGMASTDNTAWNVVRKQARKNNLDAVPALRALRAAPPKNRDDGLTELADIHFGSASALRREEAMRLAGIVRTGKALGLLGEGLEDWEPGVQVAAALGLLSTRHGGCAPILMRYLDDPIYGPEIRAVLRNARGEGAPTDADGWRRWFVLEGMLADDREGGTPCRTNNLRSTRKRT
ncbi:MAG: carboxypeptidase regulatory-like domain-containing protein [Planctomycetes bacterium]|nr:carboxypeptidase regulatory-like domain-containing protein [Planctomycetota bacterium]